MNPYQALSQASELQMYMYYPGLTFWLDIDIRLDFWPT